MSLRWREINTIEHMQGPDRDLESESTADARASVLQAALNYGNERSFNGRVERELEGLRNRAAGLLRETDDLGVVAVIGFSQTEHFAGSRKMFRWANLIGPPYIFGAPQAGIDHFRATPHAASNDGSNANRHKLGSSAQTPEKYQ